MSSNDCSYWLFILIVDTDCSYWLLTVDGPMHRSKGWVVPACNNLRPAFSRVRPGLLETLPELGGVWQCSPQLVLSRIKKNQHGYGMLDVGGSTMNNSSYSCCDCFDDSCWFWRFVENDSGALWKAHSRPRAGILGPYLVPQTSSSMELNVAMENSAWISFVNSWFNRNMMMDHYLELTEWPDSVLKSKVKGHHQNVPNGSSQLLEYL